MSNLNERYWKETDDLAICTERKVELVLECIYKLRDDIVKKLIANISKYEDLDQFDSELTKNMKNINSYANGLLDYYVPGCETKNYFDMYGDYDEFDTELEDSDSQE